MVELFQMWALVEILGLVCLPLTITVFHNLPDRGWAFSKALGLAVFAFAVWFPLICFHALPFNQLFVIGIALILLACSILGLLRVRQDIVKLVRSRMIYILATEIVFLGMVFLLGWIRSYGPAIRSNEMFMDEGFIAAIMRSPHFPPNDMWFSGYSLNYYYYAHYTIALLAKLLGQSPSIAFNTGICIFFGLTAVNMFGVTCNVVAWARSMRKRMYSNSDQSIERSARISRSLLRGIPYGLLSMVMGLVLGNLASTQQWWINHGENMPFDWYSPSRVIDKTINEFPAFSFLLSCFHAHVLALAFTILAMGLAFNLFLEPGEKGIFVFGHGWRLPLTLVATALVLGGLFTMNGWDFPTYLGLTLICIGIQQWLAYQRRWSLELFLDIFVAGASLSALSFLLYLPFYLNFISPSQGIGIVGPGDRSPLSNELLIYGLFAFVFISLLISSLWNRPRRVVSFSDGDGRVQLIEATNKYALASVKNAVFRTEDDPALAEVAKEAPLPRNSEGRVAERSHEARATEEIEEDNDEIELIPLMRNMEEEDDEVTIGSLMTGEVADPSLRSSVSESSTGRSWSLNRLLFVVIPIVVAILILLLLHNSMTLVLAASIALVGVFALFYNIQNRSLAFTLLLGSVAFGLVAVCEIFFLKDVFASNFPRMNTVFKFYFQAWALLSISSGCGLFFLMDSFSSLRVARPVGRAVSFAGEVIWNVVFLVLVVAGAIYPLQAPLARYGLYDPLTRQYTLQRTNSLDGLSYLESDPANPGDYAAIRWLNANVQGDPIIVEALGPDYSNFSRVSAFTGLPTLMGWVGHEYQWRVNWLNKPDNNAQYASRGGDIDIIYTNPDPAVVLNKLAYYQAQYIYVGPLEYQKYPTANLRRFSTFMQVVYNANGVTIYKVK